jgi:uncharacterized protein
MNKVAPIALAIFLLLVAVRIFHVSYPIELRIVNTTQTSELSVVGEGKVDAVPDTGYVEAGITVSNVPTAEAAKAQMTKVNNAIIEGVKSLGIKKEDIKTTNFSVYPEYQAYPIRTMMAPVEPDAATTNSLQANPQSKISGYSGTANVSVTVRNKDNVSKVIEKVTAAGANQIGAARFGVDDPNKYREAARSKAIANAKEQAQKLAKELGISLGKVSNIVEGNTGGAYPMYADAGVMKMSATAAEPAQIEEGTQTVTSTVTLYFEKN